MAISLGGGGSASQINEVVTLNNGASTVTLADGRVYLKGGVFETNTSTYPLANSSYQAAGINFSVAAQETNPSGIAWDGNYFWVLGRSGQDLNKYSASGVYQSVSFSVANGGADVKDVVWDGTQFKVLGAALILRYSSSGSYSGFYNLTAQTSTGQGIAWDGTYYYVVENTGSYNVYKYSSSGVYQSVAFSVVSQTTNPSSITWDGTSFWVLSDYADEVFQYNSSGVYQNVSFSVSAQDTSPMGIVSKGGSDTSLFMAGQQNDKVWEYKPANGVSSVLNLGAQNYVRIA